MDTEQDGDQFEGMTVDADGPINNTEYMREICVGQAVTTTTSNVPRTETDAATEGTGPKQHTKQHKDYKVIRGSSPAPTPDDELTLSLPTTSPKRNNKLKMHRDMSLPHERTRSKTPHLTPQRP